MPFGVKSIEKRQNELINRLFTLDEKSSPSLSGNGFLLSFYSVIPA
jgi:hypothetical protein